MKKFPQTLNGHPVIAVAHCEPKKNVRPGCIVLVDRLQRDERYIVSFHAYGTEEWISGNYIPNRTHAFMEFAAQCGRYCC